MRKYLLLFIVPLLFALAFFAGSKVHAANPYADQVQDYSPIGVVNPQNALGPPDGKTVTIVGTNRFITLHLGEEGTGTLRVYLSDLAAQINLQVTFLDDNLNQITSISRQVAASTQPQTQDFAYQSSNFSNKSYRYVKLTSLAEAGIGLDAVEALDYVGKTTSGATTGGGTTTTGGGTTGGGAGVSGGTGGGAGTQQVTGGAAPSVSGGNFFSGLWNNLANWWNSFVNWMKDFFCTNWWIAPLAILLLAAGAVAYAFSQKRHNDHYHPVA